MVKHGRNKKRRAGRIGKTKLKNKTYKRWNPSPKFGNDVIKANWDNTKSPSQNLASLGLLAKPNQDVKRPNEQQGYDPSNTPSLVELFDIPDSDSMKVRKEYPMEEDDQKYIAKCMKKYGTDYGKMFRDHKINKMQHTETVLRKMGARFLLLSAEQRTVDIPAKAQQE
ncbi:unnamed protein product [Cylindrotheca closterium]|uniref:Nucleolar protein 16 n=1 Tax=Cylindrotheca closterium TaxID=2856 RepID=A0AAD2CJV1_9STRA|nr:unnamed protein product [Cylindrotheca closterium]